MMMAALPHHMSILKSAEVVAGGGHRNCRGHMKGVLTSGNDWVWNHPPPPPPLDKLLIVSNEFWQVVRGWSPAEFGNIMCIAECSLCALDTSAVVERGWETVYQRVQP